jgi:hypothetical protein
MYILWRNCDIEARLWAVPRAGDIPGEARVPGVDAKSLDRRARDLHMGFEIEKRHIVGADAADAADVDGHDGCMSHLNCFLSRVA